MHLAAIFVGALLVVAAYVFLFKSLSEQLHLEDEINARLPPDRKFKLIIRGMASWRKFRDLQKELLPDSPRPKRVRLFQLICLSLFLSGLLLLAKGLGK
jgi:hypothetical protein